jgi:pimeloyl-ACP methyl ester carboxylesterase
VAEPDSGHHLPDDLLNTRCPSHRTIVSIMHLLLLPGMDGTGILFQPLVRELPPWITPVVVNYPADQPLSYAELLPLVRDAVPANGEFLVLGESFSGPLAVMLAATRPPKLRGVILSGSFVRSPLPPLLARLAARAQGWWFRVTPSPLVRWLLLGRRPSREARELFDTALSRVTTAVLAARARAIAAVDATRELQACTVPLLYLLATHDRVVRPPSLKWIQQNHPQVEVATISAPHLLLETAPADAARSIADFAARVGSESLPKR